MGADKEPNDIGIRKNEKYFQSTKIKDTANLSVIFWYCS